MNGQKGSCEEEDWAGLDADAGADEEGVDNDKEATPPTPLDCTEDMKPLSGKSNKTFKNASPGATLGTSVFLTCIGYAYGGNGLYILYIIVVGVVGVVGVEGEDMDMGGCDERGVLVSAVDVVIVLINSESRTTAFPFKPELKLRLDKGFEPPLQLLILILIILLFPSFPGSNPC
ncbi:hypothetical protein C8R42DRAFT_718895 [Lentinula raphanica]|nr:hypothetical protein C8R42DRAFT_718895 [Lentinula raphanica]